MLCGLVYAFRTQTVESKKEQPVLIQQWYDFLGGDETNPSNYVLRNPQTPPSCHDGDIMCAVKASANPTLPGKPNLADPAKEERREN